MENQEKENNNLDILQQNKQKPNDYQISLFDEQQKKLQSKYRVGQIIGVGNKTKIYKCQLTNQFISQNKAQQTEFVAKFIEKQIGNQGKKEQEFLVKLKYPNTIRFIEQFETLDHYIIILEYVDNGELTILTQTQLNPSKSIENLAKNIMYQAIKAVQFYQSNENNIIHRDIKPQNILIGNLYEIINQFNVCYEEQQYLVKIIDFSVSTYLNESSHFTSFCGTSIYCAPEVIGQNYTGQSEVFSLGIIYFMLLTQQHPFKDVDTQSTIQKILKDIPKFQKGIWKHYSQDVKNIVSKMLIKNVKKRVKLQDILSEPYFNSEHAQEERQQCAVNSINELVSIVQKLQQNFSGSSSNIDISTSQLLRRFETNLEYIFTMLLDENQYKTIESQQLITILQKSNFNYQPSHQVFLQSQICDFEQYRKSMLEILNLKQIIFDQ